MAIRLVLSTLVVMAAVIPAVAGAEVTCVECDVGFAQCEASCLDPHAAEGCLAVCSDAYEQCLDLCR
ncbi:MAG TPA: hypothetical protein VKW76_12170 [Candidatus Binatia bacterium]|nr:hypothetical protein [Candidatus Binatia bacterium]